MTKRGIRGKIQAKREEREKKTDESTERPTDPKEAIPMGQAHRHAGAIHKENGNKARTD